MTVGMREDHVGQELVKDQSASCKAVIICKQKYRLHNSNNHSDMWREMLGSGFNFVFILSRRDGSRPAKVQMVKIRATSSLESPVTPSS